jgi:hypothetical protein
MAKPAFLQFQMQAGPARKQQRDKAAEKRLVSNQQDTAWRRPKFSQVFHQVTRDRAYRESIRQLKALLQLQFFHHDLGGLLRPEIGARQNNVERQAHRLHGAGDLSDAPGSLGRERTLTVGAHRRTAAPAAAPWRMT